MLRRLFISVLIFACVPFLMAQVDVSTATGKRIDYNNSDGTVLIEGDAMLVSSTATIKADSIRANMKTKAAIAKGHVVVEQSSGTLTGSEAEYHWEASTGIIHKASGVSPPWSFTADELHQVGPGWFQLENGDFTSCTEHPPHYHLSSKKGDVFTGKKAKLKNVSFMADQTPVFWSPFYTRSLIPKKYTLRIEPGQNSRDGVTVKTILGYPFTPNTRTKFRWDFLERTGNGGGLEHEYFLPDLRGTFDSYYVRDTNPDPTPQSRRYSLLWNHYQKITQPLTLNAKVDFKSDQTFGNQFQNVGNNIRIENQVRGLISEAGLAYQFSKASLQAQFDRRDRFDSTVSSSSFISKITLPRLTMNTVPLTSKYFPFYTSFSASYVNETLDRATPQRTLRYQRSGTLGTQIRKDLKLNRNITLTPFAGYEQSWQDRDFVALSSEKDLYIGRSNIGTNYRQRVHRSTNLNLNYRYATRFRRNQTLLDSLADDFGVEAHQINSSIETWLGYANRITLSSGYDKRKAPRSMLQKYSHLSERITAPSIDIHVEPYRNMAINFRETYGLFNPQIQNSVRTPINTSGEIQLGQISRATYFSQGFSYSKEFDGAQSQVIFTNKLKFFMTPKWYVDCFLSYRAQGPEGVKYKKVFPIERTIQVVRDMHCWVLRMKFSNRPGVTEASFFIDLKANLSSEKDLFTNRGDSPFYRTRESETDISKIFPEPKL